jgi:serine/threonine-protein kinase
LTYQQRLSAGAYGEVFRAHDGEAEARVVHVAPELSRCVAFARALLAFGERRAALDHPRVVAVRSVGRRDDGLIVVTDAVAGPIPLSDLLARTGGRLAPDVALAIALGVVEGLAHAQSLGVVHGGVHPRSVLIDFHGGVRLTDFGLAWALIDAAVAEDLGDLFVGLRGYVAPELAIGSAATAASDVFAAGVLVHQLLVGRAPTDVGDVGAPPAVAAVIRRAIATDPAQRLINATELEELLEDAVTKDALRAAPPDEVARAVSGVLAGHERPAAKPSNATAVRHPPPVAVRPAPRPRGMTDLLSSIDDAEHEETGAAGPEETGTGTGTGIGPAVEDATHVEADHTLVEGDVAPELDDPISRLIKLAPAPEVRAGSSATDDERTPLPPPSLEDTRANVAYDDEVQFAKWAQRSERATLDAPIDAPAPAPAAARPAPRAAVEPPRDAILEAPPPELPSTGRGGKLALAIVVFGGAGLAAVIATQRQSASTGEAQDRLAADEAAAATARLEAQQAHPGALTITAAEGDAAVWLSLGRTPVRSLALASEAVHAVRFELDGHRPLDRSVGRADWSGEGAARRAAIRGALTAGPSTAPAFPPLDDPPVAPGPPGRGVLDLTSSPEGAEVWLLVGTTPSAEITGLEAGRPYAIKVVKDGFRPAFAAVKADDWYLAGPDSPMRPSLSREVQLERAAVPKPRRGR